ncbi:hypothetical protein [Halohasta litorea]|uniref:Uncharacterized protein n=1 Tax=Halohasta litorea TaxID=869891 RepID=A0ABD6D686_9EURY|nr:hypothetical protein [Halohasta litorea]
MIPNTVGRWLLVTLAILGVALAVPVVSAHGGDPVGINETVDADQPVVDRTDRIAWMDTHMGTDTVDARGWHMGPPVEEMATHMGLTVDDMGQYMGIDDHREFGDDGRQITDDHRESIDDHRGVADDHYDDQTQGHRGGC